MEKFRWFPNSFSDFSNALSLISGLSIQIRALLAAVLASSDSALIFLLSLAWICWISLNFNSQVQNIITFHEFLKYKSLIWLFLLFCPP